MNRPELKDLLTAASSARDYKFLERASLWEERVLLHVADIDPVIKQRATSEPLALPPVARLQSAGTLAELPAAGQSEDLCFASAREIAARIKRKEISPLDVANAVLRQAEQKKDLNAFISLYPDAVLARARALEDKLARGEVTGPLAGVPVGVKDLMRVKDHPFTGGTRAMPGEVSKTDAVAVAKLRGADSLIIGTTNLHELAYGVTSANPHFGAVVNPRAPSRIPGGSSGGSGAALAAGLSAITVGTDTGGSIRIPAACCGVVGFKPSYEQVSREGVLPLAWSLDHIGPLARSVSDAALAFEVMAGLKAGSGNVAPARKLKFVRPVPFFFDHLDNDTASAFNRVLAKLEKAGAAVQERRIAGMQYAGGTQFVTLASEGCQANWHLLASAGDRIGEDVRVRLEVGQFIAAIDYINAQRLRRQLRDNMTAALKPGEVFVLPTLPIVPAEKGARFMEFGGRKIPTPGAMTRLTGPFNFAGFPALSLPCDEWVPGLPFSLQIAGRPGADLEVLSVGLAVEEILRG
ncbi:MAG: amidase [Betaproteobacteria bacterium]|nr:amidase [Betaproteobacteria bacterium]